MLPQAAAHRDAVQVLEIRVHEDHVGPRGGRPVQELASAAHRHDPIAERLEDTAERLVEPRAGVREEYDGRTSERRARRHGTVNVATGLRGKTRQNPRYGREKARVRG